MSFSINCGGYFFRISVARYDQLNNTQKIPGISARDNFRTQTDENELDEFVPVLQKAGFNCSNTFQVTLDG
jgi:hypothetical protein